jgi:endonuclease III
MITKAKTKKIFDKLRRFYGKIDPGLSYSSIYELTISVVLSAQTTDKQVNSVTPAFFKRFPDFNRLSVAGIREVESMIKSVGLYKTKAKNIIKLSKIVVMENNSVLPDFIEGLLKLPGIGRKSANVILAMGFGIPAFPVDTHILRLANRIGYIKSSDPFKVEKVLTKCIREENWIESHLLLIKHGRVICTARTPSCAECPINSLCDYVNTLSNIS